MYKSFITNNLIDRSVIDSLPEGDVFMAHAQDSGSDLKDRAIFYVDPELDSLHVMQVRMVGLALLTKAEYNRLKLAAGEST